MYTVLFFAMHVLTVLLSKMDVRTHSDHPRIMAICAMCVYIHVYPCRHKDREANLTTRNVEQAAGHVRDMGLTIYWSRPRMDVDVNAHPSICPPVHEWAASSREHVIFVIADTYRVTWKQLLTGLVAYRVCLLNETVHGA